MPEVYLLVAPDTYLLVGPGTVLRVDSEAPLLPPGEPSAVIPVAPRHRRLPVPLRRVSFGVGLRPARFPAQPRGLR